MRFYFYFAFYLGILLIGCNRPKTKYYRVSNEEMENTLKVGSQLEVIPKDLIKRNDIIGIKMNDSKDIKFLRVVGIPGDIIEIWDTRLYVNAKEKDWPHTGKKTYVVYLKNGELFNRLTKYRFENYNSNYSFFLLSQNEFNEIKNLSFVDSIYAMRTDSTEINPEVIKPQNAKYLNRFYFGPISVPNIGEKLDKDLIGILQNSNELKVGNKISEKYYFCLGDNFTQAKDSRFLGLIPQSSIIGVVDKFQNVETISIELNENR